MKFDIKRSMDCAVAGLTPEGALSIVRCLLTLLGNPQLVSADWSDSEPGMSAAHSVLLDIRRAEDMPIEQLPEAVRAEYAAAILNLLTDDERKTINEEVAQGGRSAAVGLPVQAPELCGVPLSQYPFNQEPPPVGRR